MSQPRIVENPPLQYLESVYVCASKEAKQLREEEEKLTINFPTLVVILSGGGQNKSNRRDKTSITNLPHELVRLIAHLALHEQTAMDNKLRFKLSQPWTLRLDTNESTIELTQVKSPATQTIKNTTTARFFVLAPEDFPLKYKTKERKLIGAWVKPLALTATG